MREDITFNKNLPILNGNGIGKTGAFKFDGEEYFKDEYFSNFIDAENIILLKSDSSTYQKLVREWENSGGREVFGNMCLFKFLCNGTSQPGFSTVIRRNGFKGQIIKLFVLAILPLRLPSTSMYLPVKYKSLVNKLTRNVVYDLDFLSFSYQEHYLHHEDEEDMMVNTTYSDDLVKIAKKKGVDLKVGNLGSSLSKLPDVFVDNSIDMAMISYTKLGEKFLKGFL